jgi:tetratricopeptide (TPR) repeat protein
MLTRFVKVVRLAFLVSIVGLSGCSMFAPKPEVVDSQAGLLGPISTELQQSFADALVLLQDEKFAEAEVLLLKITSDFPAYAGPWSNLSIAQSKQERFEEALISINNALQQDQQFCQALSFKGVVLRELGQFKLAKEQYLAALLCDPSDALSVYNLGVLSDLYLHDNVAALSYYQQYLVTQGEKENDVVKSWVVDLKRRVPAEVPTEPAQSIDDATEADVSEPQLAGEE